MLSVEQLVEFMNTKMRMSHIYQPLLIRALVDAGGVATVRQLAREFLLQDESQLLYYEKRIKQMPVRVLSSHGVVEREGELVRLMVGPLTFEERSKVRAACEYHLHRFLQQRGLTLWDYRLLEADPVPGDLRYQVLKESGGRCALCGITKQERALDVDHIIPRSRGGDNTLANLQVLCEKCNRAKGNRDSTDFRMAVGDESDPACPFCGPEVSAHAITENGSVFARLDGYPVSPGHTLIIPKRHAPDYFSMTREEQRDAGELLTYLRNQMLAEDPSVRGFNVGMNCGTAAGQTIAHAHIHLIPRRDGDTPEPKGGVRGVIPERMSY